MAPKARPPSERFNEKWQLDLKTGCWLWTGNVNKRTGYGQFWLDNTTVSAHVAAFRLFVGPVPAGYQLDHVYENGCRHKHCVNWQEHLEPVTAQENSRRDAAYRVVNPAAEANRAKTFCKYGHAFDSANTYIRTNGNRTCRECQRQAQAAYRERLRATA